MPTLRILSLFALALALAACDSTDTIDPADLEVETAVEVAADPGQRDPTTGRVDDTNRFTLYSLRDNRVVLSYADDDRSDSLTTAWDIGFRGSDVILNGGTSGPGDARGLLVPEAFESVRTAAGLALVADGQGSCPDVQTPGGPVPGTPRVVCGGGGNGWYTYVPFPGGQGGYLLPTPGRTLVVRTADGAGTAKIKFQNYYAGQPAAEDIGFTSEGRYYTFEFVLNPEGEDFE